MSELNTGEGSDRSSGARDSPSLKGPSSALPYLPFPGHLSSPYPQPLSHIPSFPSSPGLPYAQQPPHAMINPYNSHPSSLTRQEPVSVRGWDPTYPIAPIRSASGQPVPSASHPGPGRITPPFGHNSKTAVPAENGAHTAPNGHVPEEMQRGGDVSLKRRRSKGPQHSAENEVEAGLALAGMGLGFSGEDVKPTGIADGETDLQSKGEGLSSPAKPRGGKKTKQVVEEAEKTKGAAGRKSCAECRRMKAKCDRVFPCSNCRKRGCALACPDQDLSCMQGKRLVLASTEDLHNRIAELEAALAHAHREQPTSSPHPLLSTTRIDNGGAGSSQSPQLRAGNSEHGLSKSDRLSPTQRSSSHSSFVLHTPISNGDHYPERTHSRMAVESLLIDEGNVGAEGRKEDDWVGANAAPALIVGNTGAVEEDSAERRAILYRLKSIVRILPDRATTKRQADRFWAQSTWYQNILRREEFEAIYEPCVYAPTPSNPLTPHKLACVLMLLTLDTYLDIEGSHENPLVGEYWEGVQRCFETHFGWGSSVAGVQALGLASLFVGFGWRGSGASNFYWLRQMTSAAQQLGLHKDPHPSLSIAEQTFRRRVFHEMYTLDCLMSINHGQRTAIPQNSIEAKYPDDDMPMCKLKYMYMGHIKSQVIEIGCAPDSLSKDDLEAKVQNLSEMLDRYSMERQPEVHCPILTGEQLPPLSSSRSLVNVKNLTRSTTSMCHFKSMMFLHRPTLRRLIERLRAAPLSSTLVGHANLTVAERNCIQETFVASTSIIAVSGFIARYEPSLATRLWSTWVQTFSAAVSLAALAIWCGPYMEDGFIRRAYDEMRGGCDMIREHGCPRAQGVLSLLPILCSLVENRYPGLIGSNRPTSPAVQQGEDMIFVLLGGQVNYPSPPPSSHTPSQPRVLSNPVPNYPQTTQSARIGGAQPRSIPTPFWNDLSIGPSDPLPTTWLQPPGNPSQGMSLNYQPGHPAAMGMGIPSQSAPMMDQDQQWMQRMEQAEIWARLQTFYEPSMSLPFWAGAPGAGTGMGAGAGAGAGMMEQGGAGGGMGAWAFEPALYATS